MQVIDTQIKDSISKGNGMTVVFNGDGGERVTVELAATETSDLTHETVMDKARVVLLQIAAFETGSPHAGSDEADPATPAVQSMQQERADRELKGDDALEEGIEDTFPASDAVSSTYTSTPGAS